MCALTIARSYSTIWLAKAVPEDGEVITLEVNPKHAQVAQKNLDTAGVGSKVKILLGPALDTMPTITGPVDLIFIDADKDNNPGYYETARKIVRKGGVIIVDNVVRNGRVSDPNENTSDTLGVRKLLDMIKNDQGVDATTLATVGDKGWDGFTYAYVL